MSPVHTDTDVSPSRSRSPLRTAPVHRVPSPARQSPSAFGHLGKRCNHPKQKWEFQDASGAWKRVWAPHLPLAGRKVNGQWATAAAAAYPTQFIKACVEAIRSSGYGPKDGTRKPKLLHLFSGPSDRADGFKKFLGEIGWDVEEVDIINVKRGLASQADSDLNSDALWVRLLAKVKAKQFDFIWFGTPCTTWSAVRGEGEGPRALRSVAEPYGIKRPNPPFSDFELTQLKQGTAFVLRTFLLARAVCTVGGGFCIENPAPKQGHPSIFKLAEFQDLQKTTGCQVVDLETNGKVACM